MRSGAARSRNWDSLYDAASIVIGTFIPRIKYFSSHSFDFFAGIFSPCIKVTGSESRASDEYLRFSKANCDLPQLQGGSMAMRYLLPLVQFALLIVIVFTPRNSGFAQDTKERWVLGIHGGGNLWIDDYNKRAVGEGGDLMLRYGLSRAFSLGLVAGYEELKSKQDPALGGVTYLSLHAIPASLMGWIHFAPNKPFNPHFYFGAGGMIYKRTTHGNAGAVSGQTKSSFQVPVGVGLEAFTSDAFSIALDAGYRFLDDYTDGRNAGKIDGYATAKLGVNFYFGTSAAEKQKLAVAELQHLKDSTEAEARREKALVDAESQRMKAQAEAEIKRLKDSTDAEARRVAELNARRLADTVMVLEKGKTVTLKGVKFQSGKATLTYDSEVNLDAAFRALNANPDLNVLIVGHTDNIGNPASNKALSLRRAEAVKRWLVRSGISAKRLTVAGMGSDEPIDDNFTPEGRANNRRIEFRVLK